MRTVHDGLYDWVALRCADQRHKRRAVLAADERRGTDHKRGELRAGRASDRDVHAVNVGKDRLGLSLGKQLQRRALFQKIHQCCRINEKKANLDDTTHE